MGTGRLIQTRFTNSRIPVIPAIPGLLSMSFYGSMGSGNNGNLVLGGPPLVQWGVMPLGLNYISPGTIGTFATIATPTVTAGAVNPPVLLTGGSNYVLPSRIQYFGGGGNGATDYSVVGGGQVTGFINHAGGTGYTTAPTSGGPAGNVSVLDTGIGRASILTPGWTIATVCRVPALGPPSLLFGDSYAPLVTGFPMSANLQNTANLLTLNMFSGPDCSIQLPSAATQWRFIAHTFSGVASGICNLFSLSDGLQSPPSPSHPNAALANGQQICFGGAPQVGNNQQIDVSFSMVASGPLSYATLQPIYASVKQVLASRNITVL
jgi:hypothetical protein